MHQKIQLSLFFKFLIFLVSPRKCVNILSVDFFFFNLWTFYIEDVSALKIL